MHWRSTNSDILLFSRAEKKAPVPWVLQGSPEVAFLWEWRNQAQFAFVLAQFCLDGIKERNLSKGFSAFGS